MAARIKANERQHLIQANVSQYFGFRFSDNSSAILLYATVASLPRPPVVEKIKEVKEPCSISLILSPYSLFLFLISIQSGNAGITIAQCIWMKHPYIKKCILLTIPQSLSLYISSCFFLRISGLGMYTFSSDWL